jgi:hypothetical protein
MYYLWVLIPHFGEGQKKTVAVLNKIQNQIPKAAKKRFEVEQLLQRTIKSKQLYSFWRINSAKIVIQQNFL